MTTKSSLAFQAKKFVKKGDKTYLNKFTNILSLCLQSHKKMMKEGKVSNELDEETLSNKLCRFMEDNKGLQGLGQYSFVRETAEIDEITDKTKGYSDIRAIIPNPSTYSCGSVYFLIECKLVDTYSNKNKQYIEEGINRFIIGKYSPKMNIAGMIGFIKPCNEKRKFPNGKTKYIIDDINAKLCNEYNRPKTEKICNSKLDNCPEAYLSKHLRDNGLGDIYLYHLMLDVAV